MSRTRLSPLALFVGTVLLAAALVAPVTLPAPAHAATAHPKAPTSSVSRPIAGETFTLSGTLGRSVKRYAVLQRLSGKRWVRVKRANLSARGSYRFTLTQPTYAASWRVIARTVKVKGRTYGPRVSRTRTLTRIGQSGSVSTAAAIKVGTTVTVSASFSPARKGRRTQLQVNAGSGWTTVATGSQNASGRLTARWRASTRSTVQFRAVTTARNGAGALTTAARTLAVLPTTPVAISAHRGYSSAFAENSWHAFDGAVKQRAEWIETDFRRSAPNPTDVLAVADPARPDLPVNPTCAGPAGTRFWVIMHDPTFARTTNVAQAFPGRANDATTTFTCAEIKTLKVDSLKHPNLSDPGVPTLGQFVSWLRGFESRYDYRDVRIMVEYKGSRASEFADLYDQITTLAPEWIDPDSHDDKAIFTSFGYASAFTPLLDPSYGVSGSVTSNERIDDGAELAAILDSTSDRLPVQPDPAEVSTRWLQVQYQHSLLTAARARAAHAVVPHVVAWTPVASTSIQRAAALGADIITTPNLPAARSALLR